MAQDRSRPRQAWLSGLGTRPWQHDEQAFASLLDALTRDRIETEALEREMVSTARRSMADVLEASQRAAHDELAEARAELAAFREALQDARARGGSSGDEVAYDSVRPDEDARADLLIQYLVRPGYAEVRTDEPEAGHYIYCVRVDWARLRELAREQGHPLSL